MRDRKLKRRKNVFIVAAGIALILAIAGGLWAIYRYHGPTADTTIYNGLVYGCERLPTTAGGGGLVHWVRADLNVPGVSIYLTPKDPQAAAEGFEYRLSHTSTQVADAHLAAGVNGTLFASKSWYIRLPGDLATSSETVVADGVCNHVDPNTYLMWWDSDKIAHFAIKPPTPDILKSAVWAIGAQQGLISDGAISPYAGTVVDARTMVAVDPQKRLVWIACFDSASYRLVGRWAIDHGATLAICVDGGTSTAMALGSEAAGVRPGTVTGNWRPVATVFGFRALPVAK